MYKETGSISTSVNIDSSGEIYSPTIFGASLFKKRIHNPAVS